MPETPEIIGDDRAKPYNLGMDRTPVKPIKPKISWSRMVKDLQDLGYSYADLMAIVGGGYHTFEQLRSGRVTDPRWSTGEKLRRFHAIQMRNKRKGWKGRLKK